MFRVQSFKLYILNLSLSLCLILSTATVLCQNKYRVQFTDKKNSPYSLSNSTEYLSAKAIQRRQKQNIRIEQNDLPVNPWYIDSIIEAGARLLNKSKWLNYITITDADSISLSKIRSFPFVSNAELIYKAPIKDYLQPAFYEKQLDYYVKAENIRTDIPRLISDFFNLKSHKSSLKSGFYDYGYSFGQVHMIACDSLHNMGFRGQGMTIALMDAGFSFVDKLPVFDSLRINNRILGTKDFVDINGNVYEKDHHGMTVLSTMAGNIPDIYIGTAPEADYWLLRTEDANSEYIIEEDNWVSAAEYADSVGVDVINSSLGYSTFYDISENHSYNDLDGRTARISKAAALAARKGIIVVSSAGNEGTSQSWGYHITVPADADSILSVGAVDMNGRYADFSSRGPTYDGRLKPDVAALGYGTALATVSGNIEPGNGTSFSSPIIAGMSACLWQSKPSMSNMKIISAIQKSCNHYYTPDIYTGYGIPNAVKAHSILSYPNSQPPSITVAPNPFTDEIYITLVPSTDSDIKIQITDIAGKIIFSNSSRNKNEGYRFFSINNIHHLSSGVYFLKVITPGKIYINKLIKIG
jgi:serine protease AprX